MILEIDVRENSLIKILKACQSNDDLKDVTILEKQLPIGDIIIKNNEEKELLIIERKTPSDLIASIKDGRYNEQSLRLNACEIHNHNIVYLIEGNINSMNEKWDKTLQSSIFSILYYKGFSIWKTTTTMETVHWLCSLIEKLQRSSSKTPFYSSGENVDRNETNVNYASTIKRVKSDNISKDNIHVIMLSQIPNVSANIAKIIIDKYSSIFELKKEMENNPNCLNDLRYTISNGSSRKINKNAIENIFNFL
jgi:ERCC4-type nuclease